MTDYKHHHWELGEKNSLLDLKLKDTWEYRDLLWLLVRRDFVSAYKQTILGPLWFVVQPLLTTIVYTIVFGKIAGIKTGTVNGSLFYMAGITLWNYFSDCFLKISTVFKDNATIFGKVYFPRLVIPLSIVASNLVRLAIQMLLFLLLMIYYSVTDSPVHPNIYILLFPVLVLMIAALSTGGGMLISALTVRYRDLTFLVTFGMQLLMYATTVIYPLATAPEKYKWLIKANPMTAIIETFRYGFLGEGSFDWSLLGYSAGAIILLMATGLIVFTKVEKNFIDTV